MRKGRIITLLLVAFIAASISAQSSSTETTAKKRLDIRTDNPPMNLFQNFEDIPLLVAFDNKPVETSKVSGVDISKDRFSSKELAAIIGVKPKQVKAYRILKGSDATQLWGIRGYNGVMEILSPYMYRQLKKQGNLENFRRAR